MSEPTQKQVALLAKFEYEAPDSFEEASAMIDEIAAAGWKRPDGKPVAGDGPRKSGAKPAGKSADGPATDKQKALLDKFGYETEGVTFAQASELIDELAANNWQPLTDDED